MKKISSLALGLLGVASMSANAALDVATVTTGISDAATAVASIGAAVTLVVLGIVTYKWIRRSL